MVFSFLEITAIFPHLRKLFSPEGREIMEFIIFIPPIIGVTPDIQEQLLGTREGANDLR